jgi:hypothetical protein
LTGQDDDSGEEADDPVDDWNQRRVVEHPVDQVV